VARHRETLLSIFEAIRSARRWDNDSLPRILAQHPRPDKGPGEGAEGGYYSKIELVTAYKALTAAGDLPHERAVLRRDGMQVALLISPQVDALVQAYEKAIH